MKKLTVRQQANRIEKMYLQASYQEIKLGKMWYRFASIFAFKLSVKYEIKLKQACDLISILSPQNKWEQNKIDAIKILSGKTNGIFATKQAINEALMVVNGKFEIPESRTKTFAFSKAIETAGYSDRIVIDRHAISIAEGRLTPKGRGVTKKEYRDAETAYNVIANKDDLPPSQIQAITWLTYKRIVKR